jgi:hypothetical protein
MFNFMDELFTPGRKHTEDERNRLELTREDEGSNDPGRGMIDLDSGSVVIRPPRDDSSEPEAGADADTDAEAGE